MNFLIFFQRNQLRIITGNWSLKSRTKGWSLRTLRLKRLTVWKTSIRCSKSVSKIDPFFRPNSTKVLLGLIVFTKFKFCFFWSLIESELKSKKVSLWLTWLEVRDWKELKILIICKKRPIKSTKVCLVWEDVWKQWRRKKNLLLERLNWLDIWLNFSSRIITS